MVARALAASGMARASWCSREEIDTSPTSIAIWRRSLAVAAYEPVSVERRMSSCPLVWLFVCGSKRP
eukprot:1861727-Prymnesium_polylepis.1